MKKTGLKLNIKKMKIMASCAITLWQIDGETMETLTDFIFLGSKITTDMTAAMDLKDASSLEDSVLKSRDITLWTKGICSQSCGFSSSQVRM